jgi:hypothetical protein
MQPEKRHLEVTLVTINVEPWLAQVWLKHFNRRSGTWTQGVVWSRLLCG